MTTTGLVTRFGGDTLVPATESDSPIATGRTDTPAATGAGAEPAAGTAVGVAVAVSAVAVVAGTGAAAPAPKPDWRLAAGVPGSVAPAGEIRLGAELAAAVPTVEVALEIGLFGAVVAAGAEMLPPVVAPGPALDGSALGGGIAAAVEDPVTVALVCATAAGAADSTANSKVAPATPICRFIRAKLMRPSDATRRQPPPRGTPA